MKIVSYRDYLKFIEKPSGKYVLLKKSALTIVGSSIVVIFALATIFYYQYQKELPTRQKLQYLSQVSSGFIAGEQSLSEVLNSMQVAGAKVQVVDALKESSNSASGYFVSIDDIQKSLSQIQSTEQNLKDQQEFFQNTKTPQGLEDLNAKFNSLFESSQKLLETIQTKQQFEKQILLASGPGLYLPILSDESLWQKQSKDEVKAYYQKAKDSANTTLANLSKLDVPDQFKNYFDVQNAYLTLLVKVSDNIINTLALKDDIGPDAPTQMEKAYSLLINAKKQNEELSQKLLTEKTALFDISQDQSKLAQVKLDLDSTQNEVQNTYQSLPQTKLDKIPFLNPLLNFFGGLQT